MELDKIGREFDTDKTSAAHDYLNYYDRRLQHLRDDSFTMIEVGVLRGGSLKTWAKYFPNAKIVGLDVTPECAQYQHENAFVRIGDATNTDFIFDVISEFGKPLIFLDDGSHRWDHMIFTLKVIFPLLRPGGFFIMEDIDTSFQAHLENAPFQGLSEISPIDYLAKLCRVVAGENALKDEAPYDLFTAEWAKWVGTVEIGRRTAIISKKLSPGGGPT